MESATDRLAARLVDIKLLHTHSEDNSRLLNERLDIVGSSLQLVVEVDESDTRFVF